MRPLWIVFAPRRNAGTEIIRDKTAMSHGDRISKIYEAHRPRRPHLIVLAIRSWSRPTASASCSMFGVTARKSPTSSSPTHACSWPCAKISTPIERGRYAVHWRQKLNEMMIIKEHGGLVLSDDDNAEYRLMTRFVNETATSSSWCRMWRGRARSATS